MAMSQMAEATNRKIERYDAIAETVVLAFADAVAKRQITLPISNVRLKSDGKTHTRLRRFTAYLMHSRTQKKSSTSVASG